MKKVISKTGVLIFIFLQSCSALLHQATNLSAQTKRVVITDENNIPIRGVICGFNAPFSPKTNSNGKLLISEKDAVGTNEILFVHNNYKTMAYPSFADVPSVIVMRKNHRKFPR
jgi:hypothetical protein